MWPGRCRPSPLESRLALRAVGTVRSVALARRGRTFRRRMTRVRLGGRPGELRNVEAAGRRPEEVEGGATVTLASASPFQTKGPHLEHCCFRRRPLYFCSMSTRSLRIFKAWSRASRARPTRPRDAAACTAARFLQVSQHDRKEAF